MAIKEEIKKIFKGTDIDGEDEFIEQSEYIDSDTPASTSIFENKVESTSSYATENDFKNKASQMVVFEPRAYSETQGIADHLKSGRGCIINLHRVSKDQAKRIIDFLSGVVYAIEGEVQKIGPNVFLCTPSNFGVYGTITDNEE